jgi:hypothetical protein
VAEGKLLLMLSRNALTLVVVGIVSHAVAPISVVQAYLSALKTFDHDQMAHIWADDAVSVAVDGASHPVDRESLRSMRGFERALNTKWSWTIGQAAANDVTVRLVESNDLYGSLGAGECIQTVVYSVRAGKITRMATKDIRYSGQPFRQRLEAFQKWRLTTAAASDPTLFQGGHRRFTAESARNLRPWLEEWQHRSGTVQPAIGNS